MEHIPAIVIGSGFGGSVAALRLAEAGVKTVLLERGKRWIINDPTINETFSTFDSLDGRAEWLNDTGRSQTPAYEGKPITKYTGIMECVKHGQYTFLVGAGVGGGSHCYGGILIEPPETLWNEQIPLINYVEMQEKYFPIVHKTIGSSPIPDDILDSDYYLGLKTLIQQAQKAGFYECESTNNGMRDGYTRFKMGIDWNKTREEIANLRVASQIKAEFWFGQNSGAKQTLDTNYLRYAEETGNLEIRPLHRVDKISEVNGLYIVEISRINTKGEILDCHQISCDHLFLAAGVLGTCELLLRAQAQQTIPDLSADLGCDLGNDGDTFAIRTNLDTKTNPHLGGPGAIAILNYENPVRPTVMMRAPLTKFEHLFPDLDAIGTFIFSNSPHRGKLTYDLATNQIGIDYELDADAIKAAESLLERFQACNGGDIVPPSVQITGHQLGGAVMGKVCDSYGRVVGKKGLYVVDGALLPGSSTCMNPALTIAAVAERALETIIRENIRAESP
jgi:cholesterol oxidase